MEATDISKPWTVELAIPTLSATLIAGLLRTVFGTDLSDVPIDPLLFYGMMFGATVLAGLVLRKIWCRENWARIAYAVFFGLGLFKTVPALGGVFDASLANGLFSAALVALKIGAIVLLFLPLSNIWFQQRQL